MAYSAKFASSMYGPFRCAFHTSSLRRLRLMTLPTAKQRDLCQISETGNATNFLQPLEDWPNELSWVFSISSSA